MPLLKTTAELKEVLPSSAAFDIEDLLPTLAQVERIYLAEQVLGPTLYNELHLAYQDDDLDTELEDLREACLPAVCNLAVHEFTGQANVELTSGGLAVGTSDQKAPASEWRTRDFERSVLRAAYRGLDTLIAFLRDRSDEYPAWEQSPQALLVQSLVPSTAVFNAHIDIGSSGWLFWRMRAKRNEIEATRIAATICSPDLLATLQAESAANDSFTGPNATIAAAARAALCHLTLAESISELALQKDERGVWTFESLVGGLTSSGIKSAADNRLDNLIRQHTQRGDSHLARLATTLKQLADAGQLPTYAATTCYAAQVAADQAPAPTIDPTKAIGNLL